MISALIVGRHVHRVKAERLKIMAEKIIFLDIDGPMIPGRMFIAEGHTDEMTIVPFAVSKFDPIAVGMINLLCEEHGWQIVLHSSWIRIVGGARTYEHCLQQGLRPGYFHKDAWCDEQENWRYTRVAKWLKDHPDIQDYVILDDTPYSADLYNYEHPPGIEYNLVLIDFDDGLLAKHYRELAR